MSIETNAAKHAIHDKLESRIKTAEAKLQTLKARAEVAKADAEIKAVADLLTRQGELHLKLEELKKSGADRWQHAKSDLEARIAAFEKAVFEKAAKEFEAKAKAH